ncbi:hypothetical protein BKA69DRAFT_1123265 [Paraphysoderma sedebokerense]|nr:hypothetical protein BKA69DRAFT_1123265 [Paraphysoderma sedebokerense]
MSHQINFSAHGQEMQSYYRRIMDGDESINWVIFGYDKASNDLKVAESGDGGLDELVEEFEGSKIQYALVRVKDPNSGLPKVVLIAWCGQGVPVLKKGLYSSHLNDVCSYLKGYNIQINARSDDDIDPKSIMRKVKDSSGAKYSVQEGSKAHLQSSSAAAPKTTHTPAPAPSYASKPSAPATQKPSSYTPSRPNYTPPAATSSSLSYKPPSTAAPTKPSTYKPSAPAPGRAVPTPSASSVSANKPSYLAANNSKNAEQEEEADPSLAGLSPSQIRAKQAREAREAELKQFTQLRNAKQDEDVKREEERREQAHGRVQQERMERERQEKERREREEREKQAEMERQREREAQNRKREQERVEMERRKREQQEREEEERRKQEAEEQDRRAQAEAEAEAARAQMDNMTLQSEQTYTNGTEVTAVALYDYDAVEANEMSIREGELITSIQKMDDGWWFGRIEDREGLFPANYVEEKAYDQSIINDYSQSETSYPDTLNLSQSQPQQHHEQDQSHYDTSHYETSTQEGDNSTNANLLTCVALYDFSASEENEVSFNEGQRIVEVDMASDDWWCGTVEETGARGYFPKTYVDVA